MKAIIANDINNYDMNFSSNTISQQSFIINQIIMECLIKNFNEKLNTASKNLSNCLKKIDSNNPKIFDHHTNERKFSRTIEYLEYYRSHLKNTIFNEIQIEVKELSSKDMYYDKERKEYKINPMQFLEILNMHNIRILKKITEKQIVDSKKVSIEMLKDLYNEYDQEIQNFKKRMVDDESTIFYTIALFKLETRYPVQTVYKIAEKFEIEKIQDDAIYNIIPLIAFYNIPNIALKENCFFIKRFNCLENLKSNNITDMCSEYISMLKIIKYVKGINGTKYLNALDSMSDKELAEFIKNDYWMWNYIPKEREWSNKKIKLIRKIFNKITRDIPAPKIK